ncbi:MAG: hypothetical protein IIY23_01300, partial [Erysipelotrichaceae bacterium]|nr:hypothetical protein [Erysipelotrichaceae bacterium]
NEDEAITVGHGSGGMAVKQSIYTNYDVTFENGDLIINKAKLTVKAKDQTHPYTGEPQGENNKTYTSASDITAKVEVTGLKGSDALTSITLNGQETNADEYPDKIVPSAAAVGKATNNYQIEYVAGKLTITRAKATIIVKDQTYTYNGSAQGEEGKTYDGVEDVNKVVRVEGLKDADKLITITLNEAMRTDADTYEDIITVNKDQPITVGHGTGTMAVKQSIYKNYDVTFENGDLIINKKPITVTFAGTKKTFDYDGTEKTNDEYTITPSDRIYHTEWVQFDRTPILKKTNAGEYALNLTKEEMHDNSAAYLEGAENFDVTFVVEKDLELIINKAKLTVKAKDQTHPYTGNPQGENNKTYTSDITAKVEVTGLKGSDKLTSITLNGQETNAGEYPNKIVPSAAAVGKATNNYEIEYVAGKLTITKAKATIIVKDQTYTYNGSAQGEEGATYNGVENVNSVVRVEGLKDADKLITITLNEAKRTDADTYEGIITVNEDEAITVGHGSGGMAVKQSIYTNYDVTFVDGDLIINKAKLTVKAKDQTHPYTGNPQGENNQTYTSDIAAKVEVTGLKGKDELTSITLNGQETNAGEYPNKIVPSAAAVGKATNNYE